MPNRHMIPVQPTHLYKVWPSIREELASIGSPDHFIPEDVYAACKSGEAALFLIFESGSRIGWTVLKVIGSDLHIWLLYSPCHDAMTLCRDELMEIALNAKSTMLTFGTKRTGWEKVAPKHGFTVRQTVYECQVEEPKQSLSGPIGQRVRSSH